jgi:hypothetical protein
MKPDVLGLEPVGRPGAAAGGGALHADFDRDIQNERQIGLEIKGQGNTGCWRKGWDSKSTVTLYQRDPSAPPGCRPPSTRSVSK